MKYEISVNPGQGYESEGMKDYLVIAKSKLGMNESSEVVNYALYRQSSWGLFANRIFKKGEQIGPSLGKFDNLRQ